MIEYTITLSRILSALKLNTTYRYEWFVTFRRNRDPSKFRKQFTGRFRITAQKPRILIRRVIKRWTIAFKDHLAGPYLAILNQGVALWQPGPHAYSAFYTPCESSVLLCTLKLRTSVYFYVLVHVAQEIKSQALKNKLMYLSKSIWCTPWRWTSKVRNMYKSHSFKVIMSV